MKNKDSEPNLLFHSKKIRIKAPKLVKLKLFFFNIQVYRLQRKLKAMKSQKQH